MIKEFEDQVIDYVRDLPQEEAKDEECHPGCSLWDMNRQYREKVVEINGNL